MKEILILFITASLVSCGYREQLSHFLHDFEELAKENIYLEHVTNFTVLSAMKIYVKIELKDKVFHASLQPHTSLFHPNLVVKHKYRDGEKIGSINIEEFLEGSLLDMPGSRVLVHMKDGIVTGSIQVDDQEKYFIEPSHKHIKEPHDFHMIAYKLSDVKFNFTKPGEDGGHFCGHDSHVGQAGYSEEDFDFMIPKTPVEVEDGFEYTRKKRDADKKNRCPLALIADYKFYELHGFSETNTINYMIGLIQNIDPLYKRQSLDPEGSDDYKDYGFSVQSIEVIMDTSETDTESYKYVGESRGVSDLLKNFAFGKWDDFCLAHLFTNYDFDGGVLGLAYVASPYSTRVGGVCTRTYNVGGRTKHLNVGLTTGVNYGRALLQSELLFVTGHEFGHNWGSSHDSDTSLECAPKNDRYMMYPAAVDGSQPNNYYFSPCSKKAINDVLRAKSDTCFTPASAAMCGNGVVEEGEECDQGTVQSNCCRSCKFTANSVCEPLNDKCCGDTCQFVAGKVCLETGWNEDHNVHCYKDFTCQPEGDKYTCQKGAVVPSGDVCFDNGRCNRGECLPLCEFYGKRTCACTDEANICKQCCKDTADGECTPFSQDGGEPDNLSNGKICGNGNCENGVCIIGAQDLQEKFWEVMDRLDVNMVLKWFKNNIVFATIIFTSIFWIPISIFVDWLDDRYDLGVLDEFLGSSEGERKPKTAGTTMLLQEKKSLSDKKSGSPSYLYPKLDDTGV